jgi:hypothetical protein
MDEKPQVPTNPAKQSQAAMPPAEPPGALGQPMPRSRLATLLVLSFILLLIALASAFMLWSDMRNAPIEPSVVRQ